MSCCCLRVQQVLIKVHAAGVNPVDTYIRSGNYARKPALPYTPGSDAAGVVEAVGEKVTTFKVRAFLAVSCHFYSLCTYSDFIHWVTDCSINDWPCMVLY